MAHDPNAGQAQSSVIWGDHHGKEETHLFPALERKGVPMRGCPLGALLAEHQKGRTLVKELSQATADYARSGSAARNSLIKSLRGLTDQIGRAHV